MTIRLFLGGWTAIQTVRRLLYAEFMRDRLATGGSELNGVGGLIAVGLPME
ncbi:hypothetical protein [Actinomadura sp. 7K507]|uniref:hypothetical protein n=1 Tax=Actinomadura sp. 7K507 TaxID=2530365 RepID=UPI00140430E1|nr:hypothetical protein [Actinomadura sp. 7K507]